MHAYLVEARCLDEHDWYSLLAPMADKWKEFGEKVEISEDRLDEICTNNPDNIQCLNNVVDIFYTMKKQTEIVQILRELEEQEIADKCDSPQESELTLMIVSDVSYGFYLTLYVQMVVHSQAKQLAVLYSVLSS